MTLSRFFLSLVRCILGELARGLYLCWLFMLCVFYYSTLVTYCSFVFAYLCVLAYCAILQFGHNIALLVKIGSTDKPFV